MKQAMAALPRQGEPAPVDDARALAERHGYRFVDLTDYREDIALWQQIPMELLARFRFVPLRQQGRALVVAVADPGAFHLLDDLELLLGRPLLVEVARREQIEAVLERNANSAFLLEEASQKLKFELVGDDEGADRLRVDEISAGATEASPIIQLVDSLILNAVERRASDIHVESKEQEVRIKYRIDGALYPAMAPVDRVHQQTIVSRIKVMAELDVAERRVPQDGRFKLKVRGRTIDFRVSIMPSIFGEDAVIRILDKETINERFAELKLDVLGFPLAELKRFRKYITEPYGMILVTGPTGSGKTTTLYAALSEIASPEEKIVTIEDPVEYQIAGITQVPVNEKKGLSFARGLRSILRHDPDKIMVGEVRDSETAKIAVQAALTGHLVFTTVHANNVFDVIGRFIHMDVEPYNFVSAINCILAQRLVRVVCASCRREVRAERALLEESGLDPELYREHIFFEGGGCRVCGGTGFRGRTAVCELLDLSDNLRQMILDRRSAAELKRAAREEGMIFLRHNALDKVFAGITTLRETNRVTFVD
jgi:type II secretory ATPase GspE/PulE/Tfp pilus assembly ATPase PilB-like protein